MALKISVAIATFDEEKNIKRCLDSVRQLADEIVVVDGGSDDKTVKIASSIGRSASGRKKPKVKVFVTDNPLIFHINKQKAIDKCNGDWILQLDADEVVTASLREEIKNTYKKSKIDKDVVAYYVPRKNYFLGHWLKKGGQYPDCVIRLFRDGKAYLPCKSVHEQMKVKGRIGYLKGHLLHFTAPTFSRYLTNANRYTSLTAREMIEQKVPANLSSFIYYLLIKPLSIFFSLFIRHKGFLDGFYGFVWAFFSALHYPIAYIKYWELRRK